MVDNKVIIYKSHPTGIPVKGEHLVLETRQFDLNAAPPSGGVITKNIYVSYDPYLRSKLRDSSITSYTPAFPLGQPIFNHAIARVLKSDSSDFKQGEIVRGLLNFEQYSALSKEEIKARNLEKVNNKLGLDLKVYLGAMGMPGSTAYSGLYEIGEPKKGQTIFITSASGPVGQMVGQLAHADGLKVIGSVGSDEKLDYIVKELNFDAGFNYKKEKPADALARLCPEGLDIYWDNVGGETLEVAIEAMKYHGRIIACGMISQINATKEEEYGVKGLFSFVEKRLTMRGFIQMDPGFGLKYEKQRTERVGQLLKEGTLPVKMSVTDGLDNGINGLLALFNGGNFGKAVLKIAEDES